MDQRTRASGQDSGEDYDADTIASFCRRNRISQSFYFKLRAAGRGPREMRLERKVLITREAGREWRRQREADVA